MCCVIVNNFFEVIEEKEFVRFIFIVILFCLIEEKRLIIFLEIKEVEGKEKKIIVFWYSIIISM